MVLVIIVVHIDGSNVRVLRTGSPFWKGKADRWGGEGKVEV